MSGHGCDTLSVLGAAPSMSSLGSARYTTLRCALNRSPIDASAPVVPYPCLARVPKYHAN